MSTVTGSAPSTVLVALVSPYDADVPYSNCTVVGPPLGSTVALSVADVCVTALADPVVAVGGVGAASAAAGSASAQRRATISRIVVLEHASGDGVAVIRTP